MHGLRGRRLIKPSALAIEAEEMPDLHDPAANLLALVVIVGIFKRDAHTLEPLVEMLCKFAPYRRISFVYL